jgi:hypothetical protein
VNLMYLAGLYLRARVMSWLIGTQYVYIAATFGDQVYKIQIAEFREGRFVKDADPIIPDHVPEEWVPQPPDSPDVNN